MDWNDVQLIVAIGRSGSFARASTLLGASKPTVGRRVAALERSAGVGLFRRSPQGVELTEAGLELLGRAEKLAEDMRHFEVVLGSLKNTKIPVVTVAMSEGVASYLMTPVLARAELGPLGIAAKRLQLEMPQISIVTSARASEADIELVWTTDGRTPRGSGSDKICKLADVSFVPFYSPRYASHAKLPASFDAFANHQLISLKAYAPFGGPAWDEWHSMVGERAKDPMLVEWSSSVAHLVGSGSGIGLLPTYSTMYLEGMMTRLMVDMPPLSASIWALRPDGNYRDVNVQRCWTALRRIFREADWMVT